ncbi:MAG: SdrD B-like domain-containing protein, partial [Acidimicrobiia bacterium]
DLAGRGGFFTFDFSAWGPGVVTWDSLTVIDLEADEGAGELRLFDAGGSPLATVALNAGGGDNTAAVTSGPIAGVGSMVVFINQSGSIDNLRITTEVPIIDLELTKTVDDDTVTVGDAVTFTVAVTNQGPDNATGVAVTDTLPAALTYVSDDGGGAFDAASGVWTIGNLAVGATVSLQLTATVDQDGTFVNEAEVTAANEQDSDSTPGDGTGDDWDDATVTAAQVLASGLIGDTVWFDDDKDGIEDSGEKGVAGVTITLTNEDTSVVTTQVTNADGRYVFSALDPGNYTVKINTGTIPELTVLTTVGTFTVVLGMDEQFLTADFGIAGGLPATGLEIEQFALIGTLLLLAGGALLLVGRRRVQTII